MWAKKVELTLLEVLLFFALSLSLAAKFALLEAEDFEFDFTFLLDLVDCLVFFISRLAYHIFATIFCQLFVNLPKMPKA